MSPAADHTAAAQGPTVNGTLQHTVPPTVKKQRVEDKEFSLNGVWGPDRLPCNDQVYGKNVLGCSDGEHQQHWCYLGQHSSDAHNLLCHRGVARQGGPCSSVQVSSALLCSAVQAKGAACITMRPAAAAGCATGTA